MVRAELVGKKSKISYIILEQNAILDGVGGKTHRRNYKGHYKTVTP